MHPPFGWSDQPFEPTFWNALGPSAEADGLAEQPLQVNGFTDADGWRYARHFGRGAVWRTSDSRATGLEGRGCGRAA